jgi:dTDP-4-dehydrorhamnose reductase
VRDVLVTGGAGQLGFELSRAEWPRDVRVVSRERSELDITDAAAVERAMATLRPDLIVNAAAYTDVDRAEDEPERAFAVNRDGPRHLAAAGVPLIHVSTDYVFDGEKAGAYGENDATGPLGVYGESKLAGESAIRERLTEHVVVRTSWVFGARGKNFVKTMLRLGSERDVIRVVDDQRGGPTPAAALAAAIVRIAERVLAGRGAFGTFHLGGAPAVTWFGFARAVFDEARARGQRAPELVPITTAEYPLKARRAKNSELDCTSIRRAYDIEQPSWRSGLAAVLDELVGRST